MKNKVFVSGGTGFQGADIVKLLKSQGTEVVTLSPSSQEEVSKKDGLTIIPGDLGDKIALSKALKGVDKAVFTFPLVFSIEKAKEYTANFISAAENEGVSLVVFNSSFDLPKEKTGLLALDLKLVIRELFAASNLGVITLIPDIYIDNLAAPWSIPLVVEKNILPYPVQSGHVVPWISHFDLAQYVVAALDKKDLVGKMLPIGGNLLTGEQIAEAISAKIGKQVNFIGITPDEFEKQLAPGFGELAAKEISNLYRYVDKNREQLINRDFETTQKLLSVRPQSIQAWVDSVNWVL